jgi:chromosome segregation ATPase
VEPQKITLPATPPNTLPALSVPQATNATQSELSDQCELEHFDVSERIDSFKSSLLDYGRSIMDSAVNDDCDSQTLVNEMNANKEKVIAQYTVICQHLEELGHSLYAKDEEASNLRTDVAELERAKAAMEEEKSDVIQATEVDLMMMRKQAEDNWAEKEKYQKLWEEAEQGKREAEAELSGTRQENKRKRERMEKMWGNVEREAKQ